MTFRGRLTVFLAAIVLAPLVAGGFAAHLLAERQAVRQADERLQGASLGVQQAQDRALDATLRGMTPALARRAIDATGDALDGLRVRAALDFLFVVRSGRVTARAMGDPEFTGGFVLTPRAILGAGATPQPIEDRRVRVSGTIRGLVVGGRYYDRRFLQMLRVPAMEVVRGRVVASTVAGGPTLVSERMFFDLGKTRRALCLCSAAAPTGLAIVASMEGVGLIPGPPGWVLVLLGIGVIVGSLLAFELARVLSRPHERALGRLAVTEHLSMTDPLTGVPNRRHLEAVLAEEAKRGERFGRTFSVLMVDVDHFKRINDTRGHDVGDQVLVEVAARIRHSLRADLDTVARFGGEEFTVVLPETGLEGAVVVAEKIREAIAAEPMQRGLTATVSVGVATSPLDGVTGDELLRAADRALYEAKRAGRDRVVAAG